MQPRILIALTLVGLTGCTVDVPEVDQAEFACVGDADCDADYRCIGGRCRPDGTPDNAFCGNGVADGMENCDGTDNGGATCANLSLGGGTLGCHGDCTFDVSGCDVAPVCPNNTREGNEQCDGADTPPCDQAGSFNGGTIACNSDCTFDVSGCNDCGNGIIEGSEQCDMANTGGATCASVGAGGGTLGCNVSCNYDTSGCTLAAECGNNNVEPTENCDGSDIAPGSTCADVGFTGTATCIDDDQCRNLDYNSCSPCDTCTTGMECVTVASGLGCFVGCVDDTGCDSDSACVAATDANGAALKACKPCNNGSGCPSPNEACIWMDIASTTMANADVECVAAWFELGPSGSGNGVSQSTMGAANVDLVITPGSTAPGEVHVVWQEGLPGARSIRLHHFALPGAWSGINGTSGADLNPTGDASRPAIAIDTDSHPVIAWEFADGGNDVIHVLRQTASGGWDDSQAVVGSNFSGSSSQPRRPHVAVEQSGRTVVAWLDDQGGGSASLGMRSWPQSGVPNFMGQFGAPSDGWAAPAVLPGPSLRVVGAKSGLFLETLNWTGTSNPSLISSLQITGMTSAPVALAGARTNDLILIAWPADGNMAVYLSSDGGTTPAGWSDLGSPSLIGVFGSDVSVALDGRARPIVAWAEAGGTTQVHVAVYDAGGWTSLSGSNQAGGVSQSSTGALAPALAVGPHPNDPSGGVQVVCVAWIETSTTNNQVYLRCHPL